METISVALGAREYPIWVGEGLLAQAGKLLASYLSARVVIVSDSNVAPLYASALEASLQAEGIHTTSLTVPAGEASKSFAQLESLLNTLLARNVDRKTTLIALGGGVIGDLVGFAASILLRGVPFIQVPTTLLAQVDSSVGGKTAINTPIGKNLVGSFYQPRAVLADTSVLATLPPREMRAGYAEILKYGLIMDASFYGWCAAHGASILAGDAAALRHAIAQSCRFKAQIVAEDEREADRRALLNFGHTFGHALEAETGFSDRLLHGEAVAIGMVMACRLSAAMHGLPESVEQHLVGHLRALGMPAHVKDIPHPWDADAICSHFISDKKAEAGSLTFITLPTLGAAVVSKQVDAAIAHRIVASYVE
jgi:3-dehydroquinate synthase